MARTIKRPEKIEETEEPAVPFSRGRLAKGITLFIALSVTGLVLLFTLTGDGRTLEAMRRLNPLFLGLAAMAAMADVLIGALRYHILLKRVHPDLSAWVALRAHLANRFAASLTPSQTGGGPALLFMFSRGGVPVAQGLSVLVVNFFPTLVFYLVVGTLAAYMLRDSFPYAAADYLIRYGFVAFGLMGVLTAFALLRPAAISRILGAFAAFLRKRGRRWQARVAGFLEALIASLGQYHSTCMVLVRKSPWIMVENCVLTLLMYLTRYTMAYFVMLGLGVNADYGLTLGVQALLHFMLFLAPTPGGSGIAELSTGALMTILMPTHLLALFTVIHRFFLVYLPAPIGAFVLTMELRRTYAK